MANDERHYKSSKLNLIFAISSVLLLLSLVGLFLQDHDREWKHYQREFEKLDAEITAQKLYDEVEVVESEKEYKDLVKKIAQEEKKVSEQREKIAPLEARLNEKITAYELVTQKYQFAKAQYDSDKYNYEVALGHHDEKAGAMGEALSVLEGEMKSFKLAQEVAGSEMDDVQLELDEYEKEVKNLERDLRKLTGTRDILERKLAKIDPSRRSFANNVAALIRNQPVVDMLNPSLKIDQVVLKDITDDVNFMRVPKVDRCMTCHKGINNPDFKDAPQPFTTHPNLELFLASNSPHPVEEFGCTSCHDGRGRGTSFTSSAHTPNSPEQARLWKEKYHWHEMHHWEKPMYPAKYVEAGCLKCHDNQTVIPGAEKLNLGLNLIEKAGCYGCHTMEKFKDWPKAGPNLTKLTSKSSKDWVYRWIHDPKSFRHNTWMPSFFNQTNTNDSASIKRTDQEIHAMVEFLFSNNSSYEMETIPFEGDAAMGKELVQTLGCFACHEIEKDAHEDHVSRKVLRHEHGPNLIGLGSKTSPTWIYNWLKDPARYHPGTQMPSLRLSNEEASHITAYLSRASNGDFDNRPIPPVDENELNNIVVDLLKKIIPQKEAESKASQMNVNEKLNFAGEKLIRHYGCFGCHEIKGFELEKPIGVELSEEGSKPAGKLDFGNVHEIGHKNYEWFLAKLKNPRIFDRDKVKEHYDKLKMPNFHFTDEQAEAIVTAILAMVKDRPAPSKMVPRTPKKLFIEEGQKLVRQLNCQGCHEMEGEGGDIQESIKQAFMEFEGKSENEAESLKTSFGPPNLIGQGKKVQAKWLFEFIHNPEIIRPWLKVRMPTFNLTDEQTNTLVKYFNFLDDQDFPFESEYHPDLTPEEFEAGKKLFSTDYFGCVQCHIVGDQMPEGSPENWAPDFALAHKRLKPDWIVDWLKDPQGLMPGTKMPTFFDAAYYEYSGPDDILEGNEDRQIEVMRDYMISIGKESKTMQTSVPE